MNETMAEEQKQQPTAQTPATMPPKNPKLVEATEIMIRLVREFKKTLEAEVEKICERGGIPLLTFFVLVELLKENVRKDPPTVEFDEFVEAEVEKIYERGGILLKLFEVFVEEAK